jgi:hypothetical protein
MIISQISGSRVTMLGAAVLLRTSHIIMGCTLYQAGAER